MIRFAVVLLLLGASSYASPTHPKVVNGTDASPGEYPYIVSLRVGKSHSCGGSIVNEWFVVTASHCVDGRSPSSLSIQYGVLEISSDDTNSIVVEQIATHEDFVPGGGYFNDIALLKLVSPIPLSENAQPIKLPQQDQRFEDRPVATLVGWGLPYSGGGVMKHLQKVDIILYKFEDCESAHGSRVDERYHVCAGIPEGGKGQCNGDSGGPLTVDGVLVGAVSWSIKPCTIAGYPGVYSRVAHYVDWINKKIETM